MESNGAPHKIHLSAKTAELLIQGGKSHWIQPRKELVKAKGKGEMQTYWVVFRSHHPTSSSSGLGSPSQDVTECIRGGEIVRGNRVDGRDSSRGETSSNSSNNSDHDRNV